MKTKQKEASKRSERKEKSANSDLPASKKVNSERKGYKINDIFKGKTLRFVIENAEIVKNNMRKPFHSVEYDSYSSSIGILLTDEMKKEIYEMLALSYAKESGLTIALKHFLEKKISVTPEGQEIFYARVNWKKANGRLMQVKPLDVSGLDEGGAFPYSFFGNIQVGISYSGQHTFAIYLNAVQITEVIAQDGNFGGLATDSHYNPSVDLPEEEETNNDLPETQDEKQEMESKKAENGKSKFKFWGKK